MSYGNGDAPNTDPPLVRLEGVPFFPDVAKRVKWVVDTYRKNRPNGYIKITQGYRFRGQPSDIALGQKPEARYEDNASQTTTGDANQSYEWGRSLEGYTSASRIGQSGHGANPGDQPWGGAVDMDADDVPYRNSLFAQVGMTRTAMPIESWHYAVTSDSSIDLSTISLDTAPVIPTEEEELMSVLDDLETFIAQQLAPVNARLTQLTGTPETQAQFIAQITDAYQRGLGRLPDPGGLQMFLSLMVNQGWNIGQVDSSIQASDEFARRWIAIRYGTLLNREAAPEEIDGWINFYHANHTLQNVEDAIKNSDEYKKLHP